MKKFYFSVFIASFIAFSAGAVVIFEKAIDKSKADVIINGWEDFAPFYKVIPPARKILLGKETFLNPSFDKISEMTNIAFNQAYKTDEDLIEMFVGCFEDTEKFYDYELLYPAFSRTPVSVITLPDRKITNYEELKTLRAGINKNEPYSDFVKKSIKTEYNTIEFENYNEMFAALFNKEIDFIFSNYYHGLVKAFEAGVRGQLVFSKKPIWSTPMFICIKPTARNYDRLKPLFSSFVNDAASMEELKNNLIEAVNEVKNKNSGVSAPAYVKENK